MFNHRHKEKYCLILSGGGAKGVYHLGAWRALSELGIEVEAFIGNSIGAILAGFMAQGQIREMEEIADKITADFVMKIPKEFKQNGSIAIHKANLASFRNFYHSIKEKKGIDVSPLRNLLYENLDEKAIRNSGHDLGVVTFNVSDFKPQFTFLNEMEEGTVLDYLMASAAFPGLEQTVIGGKSFIDGGVVDNIPYNMARQRGYRNIIVVDISGMGVNKKPNTEGTRTIYIKNSINMGWIFDFSRPFLEGFRTLGYLDTMRVFGVLKGVRYFIKSEPRMEKNFKKYLSGGNADEILDSCLPGRKDLHPEQKIRQLLPEELKKNKDLLYCLADCVASIFQLERIAAYSIFQLRDLVVKKKREEDMKIAELTKGISSSEKISLGKSLELLFQEVRKGGDQKDSPYYNYCLATKVLERGQKILLKGLRHYYKELDAGLLAFDLLQHFP